MNIATRVAQLFGLRTKGEGQYHDGPWRVSDGWLPSAWGKYLNYWQMGYDPLPMGTSAMVEACVSAYAQTIAMCAMNHWRDLDNGGRERVTTSALFRCMRQPNDYQTRSDFNLNLVRSLYLDGNAYALALRNDRFEISSLHLMHPKLSAPVMLAGELFYELGGNEVIDSRLAEAGLPPLHYVPARDVLHVRLFTPRNVLVGDTPLTAAAMAIAASNTALAQTINFFQNRSRPSGVLETDLTLTKAQVDELRDRWDQQAKGMDSGGTPILSSGLKWSAVTMSAQDAQLAEAMKLSDQQIAGVFRVPLPIIAGQSQGPTGSTEALMSHWYANGLGFALNQVELAFDRLFGLSAVTSEYSEFDTSIFMRSAFKDRMDALTKAVIGGIYSPDEARALESLPRVPGGAGKEPRVQQQVVPLSFADKLLEAQTRPAPAPQLPAPAADTGDGADNADTTDAADAADAGKHAIPTATRGEWRSWLNDHEHEAAA